jgi:ribosomal protein S18 acetylase RimI-like enzyme
VTLDLASKKVPTVAGIKDLTPRDVDNLRLNFWSRVSESDIKRALQQYPGRSVWLPETLEYAIVSPWRHRAEVANVQHLSAVRHPDAMLQAVVDRCERHGALVVIAIEIDEVRHPVFYERSGFQLLEEVVTYDLDCSQFVPNVEPSLRFHLADLSRPGNLDLLLHLDHSSFPWLWWNSDREFMAYADAAGVEILIGYDNEEPVSYLGMTSYLGWGHLDRIAVAPEHQGRGFGGESLAFAVNRLMQSGAKRVGLSTQRRNARSQRLYERFGFRRAAEHDYRLYGRVLRLPDGLESLTNDH